MDLFRAEARPEVIVGRAGLPANQLLLVSGPTTDSSTTVDADLLPYVLIAGAVAGIWLFLKLLELVRKLLIPLVLAGAVFLVSQAGIDWPFDRSGAGASTPTDAPSIPPLQDWKPR